MSRPLRNPYSTDGTIFAINTFWISEKKKRFSVLIFVTFYHITTFTVSLSSYISLNISFNEIEFNLMKFKKYLRFCMLKFPPSERIKMSNRVSKVIFPLIVLQEAWPSRVARDICNEPNSCDYWRFWLIDSFWWVIFDIQLWSDIHKKVLIDMLIDMLIDLLIVYDCDVCD